MTTLYRFYRTEDSQPVYLEESADGYTAQRQAAGLFTERDWDDWGHFAAGLQRDEVGEDELMRLAGASMLPGLEVVG